MKSRITAIFRLSLLAAVLMIASSAAAQDVPQVLSQQGRIFGEDNQPISGPETLTFRLYDGADAVLWEESLDVTLSNGYYAAILGQTSAIPDGVLDGSTRYLGITIGDATATEELAPRLEITSVAYALKAGTAENATGALTPTSLTVGGTLIDADGTITLGAATVNTDGSIVVGNTTINPDGSISVAGNPVIGADGAVDSGAFSGTTLSDLETGGCATGQLVQFDAVTGWGCITPAAGTAYSAGAGLTLDATDTFSVDPTQVQTRVSGVCNPGEFMLGVNEDGSVSCAADADTTYAAGAGVDITGGTISLVDPTDDDTTYAAGAGLTLTGTTFDVDTAAVQARVTGVCAGTDKVTAINADGSVVCSPDADNDTTYSAGTGITITGGAISLVDPVDDDTTYTAGTGLTLTGTQFDVDTTALQTRVTGTCGAAQKLLGINVDGSVNCAADADTDTDTLAGLGCATDQFAMYDGAAWGCVDGWKVPDNAALCTAANAGTLRYSSDTLQVCTVTGWTSIQLPNDGSAQSRPGETCEAILLDFPSSIDGQYWIDPNGGSSADAFFVTCDMTGGGYTRLSLFGGRITMSGVAASADCSPYAGYGTNIYLGGGHRAGCNGSEVTVTWHDNNDSAISTSQISAMRALGMTSKPVQNWIQDPDGNLDDLTFCWDTTLLVSHTWAPQSGASMSCYQDTNPVTVPIFNQWSASTGGDDNAQNWYLERFWEFR